MASVSWTQLRPGLVVALGAVFVATSLGLTSSAVTAAQTSQLVDIRAAHHPGYDRIVFEFKGAAPDVARARWAKQLRLDPSDKPARVRGNAYIKVRFWPVVGHQLAPPHESTFGPAQRAYGLPNIAHVVLLGDVEGEVSVGIGLMARTRILRVMELRKPSRFVVDVSTKYPKDSVKVYFADEGAIIDAAPPYVVPVSRKVPRSRRAKGAMQRLYAGPTAAEQSRDLRFVASGTTGFRDLWHNDRGIARVTLRGPCDSGGSAVMTVADQVRPTLRSRPAIDWVKIYDRDGQTEQPWGRSNSIPGCLEP